MKETGKPSKTNLLSLFTTGFVQVFFIAANTYFIAQNLYVGMAIAAFMISWIWTYNVKRISASTFIERFLYCIGAMAGNVTSVLLADQIMKLWN